MVRLYDDDRTFDTIVIVLTKRQEGKQMAEHENIATTPTPTGDAGGKDHRGPSASQLAAAVEAAYILEAVRK
jgi:hypothetical protein